MKRLLLPAVLLGALAVVAALLFGREAERGAFAARHSTFRATPEGAKALYRLHERLGARVERRTEPLFGLEGIDLLFVIDPAAGGKPVTRDEASSVKRFVEAGGAVVVAARGPTEIHRAFGVRAVMVTAAPAPARAAGTGGTAGATGTGTEEAERGDAGPAGPGAGPPATGARPAVPSPYARGVARLEVPPPLRERDAPEEAAATAHVPGSPGLPPTPIGLGPPSPAEIGLEAAAGVPLFRRARDGSVFALSVRAGVGRAIFVADPAVLSNRALGLADNGIFAANLLAAARSATPRVAFDEYHHGFEGERGVAGYIGRRALAPAALQAAGAFILLAAALGGRRGRPPLLEEEEPPRSRESVRAMAEIYGKAGLAGHCARELFDAALRRAHDATGVPPEAGPARMAEALRRAGVRGFRALEGIARRRAAIEARGERAGERELLAFAREVAKFEQELEAVFGARRRR